MKASDHDYVARICPVLDVVVDSLAAIHKAGDTYPEIKPSNCLVTPQGECWLTDFGLSELFECWGSMRTAAVNDARRLDAVEFEPSLPVGDLGLLSPEQWQGHSDIDRRADVFRLGVTIYQALTLALPYGIGPLGAGMTPPASPHSLQTAVPLAYDSVILKALALDRNQRYQSAQALKSDWGEVRASHPVVPLPTPRKRWRGLVQRWWRR